MNNVAVHTNYISLYSGGGGLDLGFRLANPAARPVLYVEREFQAAALLVDHIEAGLMEPAPVWSDTGTLDCEPFVDRVDWIIGGFPCQPWSVAGARAGTDDERWLWPHIERLVREIRPRGIFVENVPGIFHGGIEHVLGGMAALGFDAEWISVRASDVGAPHRRERVFIMAYAGGIKLREAKDQSQPSDITRTRVGQLGITSSSGRSAGRHRERQHEVRDNGNGSPSEDIELGRVGQSRAGEGSEALGNADHQGLQGRRRHSGRGHERLAWPPGPSDTDAWANVPERYWPAVESEVRGMADGSTGSTHGLSRSVRLRILGNSVVPLQAALAYTILNERFRKASA